MTFSPDGPNAVASRPLHRAPALPEGWFQDASSPGAGNGTVITASFLNEIIANLRTAVVGLGGSLIEGADNMLLNAIIAGTMARAMYDPQNIAGDVFDMDNMVDGLTKLTLSVTEKTILDFISCSGPIDLDAIQSTLAGLGTSMHLKGSWAANEGTFPGGGTAQAGDTYVVAAGGTVGGVAFSTNDQISAVTNNASTTVYEGNWVKLGAPDIGALLNNAALTGVPTTPTAAPGTNTTQVASTAFVAAALVAGLATAAALDSPHFIGIPTAPTADPGTNTTQLATTAFALAAAAAAVASGVTGLATLADPVFTGNPRAPTPSPGDNDTSVSTTAFVAAAITAAINALSISDYALKASPALSGTPTAPTANAGTNTTQLATTAFVQAALGGGAFETLGQVAGINTQAGTTYTLVLGDKGKTVECNNNSAIALTVPPNSSVAFPTNSYISIVQLGAGKVTITPGAGVTIRNSSGLVTNGQYAMATLYKRGTDEWVAAGNLVAS